MTKATQAAFNIVRESIDKQGETLRGADWYELLEEIDSHVSGCMECYREENPGDFE